MANQNQNPGRNQQDQSTAGKQNQGGFADETIRANPGGRKANQLEEDVQEAQGLDEGMDVDDADQDLEQNQAQRATPKRGTDIKRNH